MSGNSKTTQRYIFVDVMWSPVECSVANGHPLAAPCARGKHSATLLGGYVYVLGGRGAGGAVPLRDFWRYCLGSGRWERLESRGDTPPALLDHTATSYRHKLYVFGGEAGTLSNETPLWIYDTESGVWRKLSGGISSTRRRTPKGSGASGNSAPRGRRGHSAHALNDCLLIYGGYKDLRGSTNELWAFHYESESWQQVRTRGAAGPARHRHAAALHDNRLYVHGGQCDLRDCADLWHYDTMSRVWTQVRTPPKLSPSARSGHAGLRAGSYLYVFGGEAQGHPTNELWRFHFATETWERIVQGANGPSPRVDCRALLVPAAPLRVRSAPAASAAQRSRPDPPASLLKEISKLSSFHIRRAARCSYTVLAADQDSTESLVNQEPSLSISKSRSAYVIDGCQLSSGDMSREPISVPDFADMILPTPVLSPTEAAKLVYLDSEDEEDLNRDSKANGGEAGERRATVVAFPKSASVRFSKETTTVTDDEAELSTSDYASAERVSRASLGFCNPHYLGPDIRKLGAALTPDSGLGPGDIELHELRQRAPPSRHLHLLLVGGKESPHPALLQNPLSMWTYRLL